MCNKNISMDLSLNYLAQGVRSVVGLPSDKGGRGVRYATNMFDYCIEKDWSESGKIRFDPC